MGSPTAFNQNHAGDARIGTAFGRPGVRVTADSGAAAAQEDVRILKTGAASRGFSCPSAKAGPHGETSERAAEFSAEGQRLMVTGRSGGCQVAALVKPGFVCDADSPHGLSEHSPQIRVDNSVVDLELDFWIAVSIGQHSRDDPELVSRQTVDERDTVGS